jgi:uncharacterized protein (DUF488 family)
MSQTVFTIGHSTHTQERFANLLKLHEITAVCDVRSRPYSRTNPQFNREDLKKTLLDSGIAYVFLGKELGARTEDATCYDGGKVQYDRLARTDLFRSGLRRIQEGVQSYRIALMCAEKEPLECHRTILVARYLETTSLAVQHIHADGALEPHEHALKRLMRVLNLPDHDMFRSHDDVVADAYLLQEKRIAYERSADSPAAVSAARRFAG